ncbi:hypothetical protein [Prosthecobacter dejongeii]|uniref:Uncharacterized protein n=1 Tax=Prosthecobacter dejongeii TaxID=48465 RepID=A0A7W7YKP9_9BACT|nr:hypothetical protein [Prosthecobacter dejongeii]MBB5038006.1 hypothetical protein [Prosthecobacter dejongeii]
MKRSERLLLGLFVIVFLVVVGGGALTIGLNHYRSITEETARLRDRLVDMNQAITEGAEWQRRSEWLNETVPTFASRQEASACLLEVIQKEAEKAGLALAGREFLEAPKEIAEDGLHFEASQGYFDRATVRLTLSAVKEQAFFTWMHGVQQPGRFLGVTRLLITPTGQGKSVNAEVEVTQFYHENAVGTGEPKGGEKP